MTHIENSREPSFLLIYAPQRQNIKFGTSKPEGSLGLLYLAGALQDNNFHVKVLEMRGMLSRTHSTDRRNFQMGWFVLV